MAEEKTVVFNLRKEVLRQPKLRRSHKEIFVLRKQLSKLSKGGKVRIGQNVSEKIWSNGGRKPVYKLKLKVNIADDGTVTARLAE